MQGHEGDRIGEIAFCAASHQVAFASERKGLQEILHFFVHNRHCDQTVNRFASILVFTVRHAAGGALLFATMPAHSFFVVAAGGSLFVAATGNFLFVVAAGGFPFVVDSGGLHFVAGLFISSVAFKVIASVHFAGQPFL